ncbi:MAG: LacI family transcriptional regulator [Firmicutes bacterium]|nr:LacI family transcriptional regulator [Bacillota bacterium]
MVTINDIAEEANVAKSTVSKVINNYSGVNEETKNKILKIMKEKNYWPSSAARILSTNKSNVIGVFVPQHLNHFFWREVIDGIGRVFDKEGYDLLYFSNQKWVDGKDTGSSFSYSEKCKHRNVDGTILFGFNKGNTTRFDKLIKSDIPAVFIDVDLTSKKTSYVISDNFNGAKKAVKYLYKLGHEKIALFMGHGYIKPAQDRLSGYKEVLQELNIEFRPDWVFTGNYTEKDGYQAMKKIMKMSDRPSAILGEDMLAIGAIQTIKDEGLSVPGDFSIMGFDDIEISRYITPGLTTVSQNKLKMGISAANLLLKIINDQEQAPIMLPTDIVERDSCRSLKQ